jgi:NDP-sugar pyrophosphorylase family protein
MIFIMAGGRGKRLMPLTKDLPKPMIPVNGKPMLEWIIKRFADQGFKDFTISLGYLGEKIEEYFGDGYAFGCTIDYVSEKAPLGTAGALSLLAGTKESFIVINGDVLASVNYRDLLRYHANANALATVGATTHRIEIPFGVLNVKDYRLQGIEEKPTYDYPIAAGIYVFSPEALKHLPDGYVDMPDFIQAIPDVSVFPISGEWHDIGTHEALCSMNSLPG